MSKPSDPVELFRAVTDALSAEEWERVASLCDPISLRDFQRHLIARYRPPAHPVELNAEWFLRHNPDMPQEVAEYSARSHQKMFGADPFARDLPAFADLAELESETPARAFALWLDSHSASRQIEKLGGTTKLPPEAVAMIQIGLVLSQAGGRIVVDAH